MKQFLSLEEFQHWHSVLKQAEIVAKSVNFKDGVPRLPKRQFSQQAHTKVVPIHTFYGFKGRFDNWCRKLQQVAPNASKIDV